MKWVCAKCTRKDGSAPCALTIEDEASDEPYWCPWSLNPMSDGEEAEWEEIKSSEGVTNDTKNDSVNKPNHYCKGGYELAPILYVWGLSHRRASAVEYIMRAGDKKTTDEIEDLRKAIRNIEMEIEYMEKYGKVKG